jgi:hypothetical protein
MVAIQFQQLARLCVQHMFMFRSHDFALWRIGLDVNGCVFLLRGRLNRTDAVELL